MIYQHRLIVSRCGRLEARHTAFQASMVSLDQHGSVLIGAWEVVIGADAGCAVFQLRQFDDLAGWERHQAAVREDVRLSQQRRTGLFPNLDVVDTAIMRQADGTPGFAAIWPTIEAVRGTPRGYVEQRTLHFRPGTAAEHHALYVREVVPALDRDGSRLLALLDTVIGPGTSNAERTAASNCATSPTWQAGNFGGRRRIPNRPCANWSSDGGWPTSPDSTLS